MKRAHSEGPRLVFSQNPPPGHFPSILHPPPPTRTWRFIPPGHVAPYFKLWCHFSFTSLCKLVRAGPWLSGTRQISCGNVAGCMKGASCGLCSRLGGQGPRWTLLVSARAWWGGVRGGWSPRPDPFGVRPFRPGLGGKLWPLPWGPECALGFVGGLGEVFQTVATRRTPSNMMYRVPKKLCAGMLIKLS